MVVWISDKNLPAFGRGGALFLTSLESAKGLAWSYSHFLEPRHVDQPKVVS